MSIAPKAGLIRRGVRIRKNSTLAIAYRNAFQPCRLASTALIHSIPTPIVDSSSSSAAPRRVSRTHCFRCRPPRYIWFNRSRTPARRPRLSLVRGGLSSTGSPLPLPASLADVDGCERCQDGRHGWPSGRGGSAPTQTTRRMTTSGPAAASARNASATSPRRPLVEPWQKAGECVC